MADARCLDPCGVVDMTPVRHRVYACRIHSVRLDLGTKGLGDHDDGVRPAQCPALPSVRDRATAPPPAIPLWVAALPIRSCTDHDQAWRVPARNVRGSDRTAQGGSPRSPS